MIFPFSVGGTSQKPATPLFSAEFTTKGTPFSQQSSAVIPSKNSVGWITNNFPTLIGFQLLISKDISWKVPTESSGYLFALTRYAMKLFKGSSIN